MKHPVIDFPCRMHSWDIYRLILGVQTMQQRCVVQAWGREGTKVADYSHQIYMYICRTFYRVYTGRSEERVVTDHM
jgi:hypothetical protein